VKTAIDSSVLWCIQKQEPGYERWEQILEHAASVGQLCICPVTFAEISPGRSSADEVLAVLSLLAISYEEILPEAAHLAGSIFLNYRQQGGPRTQMVPDFLIAAHAQVQCTHLAAIDRGYLRRYFPKLELLQP
jgi:predicted nucleic acid-binding protein